MRGFLAIYRRELAGLFVGPLAWVLLSIALALNGLVFIVYLKLGNGDVDIATRYAFGASWFYWALMALFPPLLTMRMISEEGRSGMLEFLLTAPVTDTAVVLGKFGAAATLMLLLWTVVPVYALTLGCLGVAPDAGLLCGGMLGAVLVSALFCAVGLFASSLSSTPVIAAFAAMIFNLALIMSPLLARISDRPWAAHAAARIDVIGHLRDSFLLGVVDSAYAAFFLSWTALFLFLAVRALESRRWR